MQKILKQWCKPTQTVWPRFAALTLMMALALPAFSQDYTQSKTEPTVSAQQAASIAKQAAGGKVLKVHQTKTGFRVKLLLPSGKVTYVAVDNNGNTAP